MLVDVKKSMSKKKKSAKINYKCNAKISKLSQNT